MVFAIEALTNPRIRDEIGQLQLVPPDERVSGPGSTPIMAAFTHLNPEGSRFSNGSYGVYYAAQTLETAVAEVSHHRAVFLARTAEPAIDVDMRVITAGVDASLHDLRSIRKHAAELFDPERYDAPQALGQQLREAGSWGVIFPSVRDKGGECVRPVPAEGPAPREAGRAHRPALGRPAHHALVRKTRPETAQPLKPSGAGTSIASSTCA